MAEPVTVVGGSLAGLAAAARLAKLGHPVELLERDETLGGHWAAREHSPGVVIDDAPAVIGFPAPWRDLFRKSGRPMEAELARMGYALVPAGPASYRFADGTELRWPSDRGEQFETLEHTLGRPAADRWRDLVDGFGEIWQALRPLGLEDELPAPGRFGRSPALTRATRARLRSRRTLADVAAETGHPRLEALVRSVAHRLGSPPEQVPALAAVELWIERTFGRWQVAPVEDPHGPGAGRSSVLIEALSGRLALRKVQVTTGVEVNDRPSGVVVSVVDPWTTARLAGGRPDPAWRPADGPTITHRLTDTRTTEVGELVELDPSGVPTITWTRPLADGSVISVHDHRATVATPSRGLAWSGFRSWTRRPAIRGPRAEMFQAGPWSAAGPAPAQQVLTGALAAYAVSGKRPE